MSKPRTVRSHRFRGTRYRVIWRELQGDWGLCEPNKELVIDPRAGGFARLDTIIHESMHACVPDLDEEAVDETSEDIAKLLWRLGYRGPDDD